MSTRRRSLQTKPCARPGCPETFVSADKRRRYCTRDCAKATNGAVFKAARADHRGDQPLTAEEEAQVRRAVEALREDMPASVLRERFPARVMARAVELAPETLRTTGMRLPMGTPA